MRKLIRLAVPLAALAGSLALALPAAAGVSPAKVITDSGEAGYYAGINSPGHFTQVKAHFYLRVAAKSLSSSGGMGIQLGNDVTGNAVQLGVVWNDAACPGKFEVGYGHGVLSADTDGTNTTAVNSGGSLLPLSLIPVLCAPQGHSVSLILKEISPGVYEAFGKDTTTALSASKNFAGLTWPNEASAGVVTDPSVRSAPATIKLVHFAGVQAKDSNGVTATLGGTSEWTAVQAYSNNSGDNSNPPLITPANSLSGDHFNVFVGPQTGP